MNDNKKKFIYSIFTYLELKVKIYRFNPNTCKTIISYIGQVGIIKGKKNMNRNQIISLVEFEDHNRIWIRLNELEYI